ncbi:MAG: hypothetical protein ACR2NL_00815 [Acidimicrobiia bacterium]
MRDAHEQLADYFDATVERIDAEDVLVRTRMRERDAAVAQTREHRYRPAWAMAVAFITTIVVVSGSLGLGLLLRARSTPIGAGGTPQLGVNQAASPSWVFIGGAAAALALVAIVAAARAMATAGRNGGTAMTATTERPSVDDRTHHLASRNRALTIAVVILAILAIGLGAWAVYQATSGPDELSAPNEVMSMTDDWLESIRQSNGSVTDLYVQGGYHLYGSDKFEGEQIARHLGGAEGQTETGTHEWTAEPTVMVAGEDRWVVVRPMVITNNSSSESVLSFEIIQMNDGSYKIVHSVWMVDHDKVLYTG